MAKIGCKTEIYSRVTGFFRPTNTWNPGKQEEFKDREHYNIKEVPREVLQSNMERPADLYVPKA